MPMISTIRSLYVMLPAALADVGLQAHAEALRALPLSVDIDDLLHAAEVAEAAAAAASQLAARRRDEIAAEQLASGLPSGRPLSWWDDEAWATAAESAAVAARCAAMASRYVARHLGNGDAASGCSAKAAAGQSQQAAVDAALCAAAANASSTAKATVLRVSRCRWN